MKFDLFDAISSLSSLHWDEHEVLVRNTKLGIAIRLQVYAKDEWHYNEFIVSNTEIGSNDSVLLMNLKWKYALRDLQIHIDNYAKISK